VGVVENKEKKLTKITKIREYPEIK